MVADDLTSRPTTRAAGRSGSRAADVEPVYMIPLYALALWGAFLAPRSFVVLAAVAARVQHADGDGLRRHGALPGAVGLPARAARRVRAGACVGARARPQPGTERASIELLDPFGAALLRELLERAPSRRAPRAAVRNRSPASSTTAAASASASPGGTSRPVSPASTISGRPPTALATTARPRSIASSATMPNPSPSDGTSTTYARSYTGAPGTWPRNGRRRRGRAVRPSRAALRRAAPSPATSSARPGTSPRRLRSRAGARRGP